MNKDQLIKKAIDDWNACADELNQWEALDVDEKLACVAITALAQPAHALPQGYESRPWDYSGQLYLESQMRAYAAINSLRDTTAQPADTASCQTCEALARTVMLDQTSHDAGRQPLTEDEIDDIWAGCSDPLEDSIDMHEFARAIDAKLKEKNK